MLPALDKVNGDLSDGGSKLPRRRWRASTFDTPTGKVTLDKNRNAIADNFLTEVAKGADGNLYNKVVKVIPQVNQTLGHAGSGVPEARRRRPRQPELPVTSKARGRPPVAEVSVAIASAGVGAHALELEGVGRQFGALVALAGISMRIAAGERRAVLGSNGAGKTTLFNAITGDFPPTSGRIRFFGEDVTALAGA